jgi:hypothetical protein
LGTANSVAAIGNGADIFNTNTDGTIAGWTSITNTEGFQELNIDGTGAAGQEFYSQWNIGTQTINDTYERTKWISQRAHTADSNAETGNDFIVDDNNSTTQGRGTEFSATAAGEILTGAKLRLKIGGGTPTGTVYAELWDSDDVATAAPTGTALARSDDILASQITSSYEDFIFRFNRRDPTDGSDQRTGLTMTANQEYFIVVRHADGSATNFFHVEGDTTSADDGNVANDLSGTWTGTASQALHFEIYSSPAIHGIAGEIFEGINVEVGYDGETGTGVAENDIVMWGTRIVYDTLVSGPFRPGERIQINNDVGGALKTGATVLYDDGVDELIVALDSPGASVIDDNDTITTLRGAGTETTASINVTVENEDQGGGEGIVLAKDDNGTTGELYLQVLSGVNPVDNSRIRRDDLTGDPLADYVDATATINTRTLNPEFVGTSTGSNIIGAYGIGFDPNDIGSSDLFTSLDNTNRTPPNNVAFTVSAIVAGEDRVLVGPRTGSVLDRGQWLVSTALTTLTETSLVVKTGTDTVPFPNAEENWPATGKGTDVSRLRIQRDDGIYQLIPYDSDDGTDTFTLGTGANSGVQIDVVATAGTFTRASGDFLADGFEQGARFTGSLFANGGNNASFTVDTVTATVITVVDNTGMVDETGSGDEVLTINGWDFSDATDGTGPSGWDSSQAAVNQNVFMAFIDVLATGTTASFTGVHGGTNRDLFVRVRDGGGTPIVTFESTAAEFLSTPQTIAAVRTADA